MPSFFKLTSVVVSCLSISSSLLALGCGHDDDEPLYSSGLDSSKTARTLSDDDKRQFCSTLDEHVDVAIGFQEIARIACLPLALLSTSRAECERKLNDCSASAPPAVSVSVRNTHDQTCFNSLDACEADVSTLEGCVNINVGVVRNVLESITCARFGDTTAANQASQVMDTAGPAPTRRPAAARPPRCCSEIVKKRKARPRSVDLEGARLTLAAGPSCRAAARGKSPVLIPPRSRSAVGDTHMHPGFHGWWRGRQHGFEAGAQQGEHFGERHGCGPRHAHFHGAWTGPSFDEGGVLGVRRPLRFLAYKLELNESQVSLLATVLDGLKTERAQAAVDQRRRVSALAEAVESADFDEQRIANIGDEQQKSEQRIRAAVGLALKQIHAALDEEQRKKLAYLLRTGALAI